MHTKRKLIKGVIYINQLESDPAKMITGDVNGEIIQWIRQNSHRVLAKKTGEGTVTYIELDDNNSNKYAADGSEAKTDGTEGDVFVKLPTFYYRGNDDGPDGSSGDNVEIRFSKTPFKDSIEWNANTLIGAYEAYYGDGKLQSRSGVQSSGNISQADFKSYAAARGSGYQLVDWQMHCVLGCLFYAMYGNTNSQAICGKGTRSNAKICGETNSLGMTDTKAETNGNTMSINFWGLENWWGNKIEVINESFNELEVNTFDPITKRTRLIKFPNIPTGGALKKTYFGKYLDLIHRSDSSLGGRDFSIGYCDSQLFNSSGYNLLRSGDGNYDYSGITYLITSSSNGGSSNSGSRLAFRGKCTKIEDVNEFKSIVIK